jgi:7-carboxy-7-deazaguanine synthase
MQVTEIFKSIQGEGTRAGLPCIFVRLTGCNLRCTWCDTAYAFHGGTKMTVEEVLARVTELARGSSPATAGANREEALAATPNLRARLAEGESVTLVELTGGEPLLQPECVPLAERLVTTGYTVMIETSGERPIARLPREVIKIVDVKCPDSGEADTFDMANLAVLDSKDEVKFVIATRRDYEFARDFTRAHGLAGRVAGVIFSSVHADPDGKWEGLAPRLLAEWILAENLPVRLGLQIHKLIWHPATRGV